MRFPSTLHLTATASATCEASTASNRRKACLCLFPSTWLAALIAVYTECDEELRFAAPVSTALGWLQNAIFSHLLVANSLPVTVVVGERNTGKGLGEPDDDGHRIPEAVRSLLLFSATRPVSGKCLFVFDEKCPNKFGVG